MAANRILAHEGILDAFGHVSIRYPEHPDRFIMAWARSPELIEDGDLLEFALDGTLLERDERLPYIERFIHGAIYEARPDVMAVCHNHTLSVLPFSISKSVRLRPVIHSAAILGGEVPVWNIADEFGSNTDLLVRTMEQGRSLSRTLGAGPLALMRGHGSVVAGSSLFHLAMACVNMDKNAQTQLHAQQLGGDIIPLSQGEIDIHSAMVSSPSGNRAWEYWKRRAGC
ncbi:MAG TPA: class II aldolase/adducin family protein [Chloroflexota bacterium]|nr:class II aldolase/adducin family protein [Chloroflexota bacterium]